MVIKARKKEEADSHKNRPLMQKEAGTLMLAAQGLIGWGTLTA